MLIAVYVVAMFKNVEIDEDDDFIDIEPTFDNSNEKIKVELYVLQIYLFYQLIKISYCYFETIFTT